MDKIEFLQSHENIEIYKKAFDIIERYFGTEEEDKEVMQKFFIWNFNAILFFTAEGYNSHIRSVKLFA